MITEALEIVMHLDKFSLISFFLACSVFFIIQGLQLTFERFSKEMVSVKALIGISFLIHPFSIFFFGENKLGVTTNIPLQDLDDSLIFFDILEEAINSAILVLTKLLSVKYLKNDLIDETFLSKVYQKSFFLIWTEYKFELLIYLNIEF